MIDLINLLNIVIKAMVTVEKLLTTDGVGKKEMVIEFLKKNSPEYEKYQHIVPVIIELVIILSRQKRIAVNLKKFNCIS